MAAGSRKAFLEVLMFIAVMARDGTPLMPTSNMKKVRKLLRSGRAVIFRHDPLAIWLTYDTPHGFQPMEVCEDTGYQTVGISVKSAKHEYFAGEFKLLPDEKERHQECLKNRRNRRNRLRHRAPRFDNRKKDAPEGGKWLAPSLRNKADRHVGLIRRLAEIFPIKSTTVEIAQFDQQALKAVEEGRPLPEGTDYQHGPRYGYDTLREAIFARDGHKCQVCGKSGVPTKKQPKPVVLRLHHIGFRKGDRTNRSNNLLTVCAKCHSPRNHKPGGKLWGLKPVTRPLAAAAFMNVVKDEILRGIRALGLETRATFGTVTKRERLGRHLPKTHANDAYCMGGFRPKHRAKTAYYEKRRRNNRILEKFYDAVYIDGRDGKKRKAAEMPCGRAKRSESRRGPGNLRPFRGEKVSSGRRSVRRKRYALRPGDIVLLGGARHAVKGCCHYGERVALVGLAKDVRTDAVKVLYHQGGWVKAA